MPKLKTNKSVAKRVKITKNGKVKVSRAGRRHLLSCKSAKKRRALRKRVLLNPTYAKAYKMVIHK